MRIEINFLKRGEGSELECFHKMLNNLQPISLKWILLDFGLSTSVFLKYLEYFGGYNISDFSL